MKEEITHYREMFSYCADRLKQLIFDDYTKAQLGFELGEIYSILKNKHIEMLEFEEKYLANNPFLDSGIIITPNIMESSTSGV